MYPSEILPQEPWATRTGRDELAAAVAAAHRHGLQLHAWKVCFHLGSLKRHTRDSTEAARFWNRLEREGRLVRDSRGQEAAWLNPADPRNVLLETQVAREVVSRYDVDGYHLDYIRYPDEPSFDFDYGPVSADQFAHFLGRKVEPWPQVVRHGLLQASYIAWQRQCVTRAVRAIREAVRATRSVPLSAAVWRNNALHCATVKQDWPRWTREGLLDFVVLMNYERTLEGFHRELENALLWNNGARPLVAGIGSWRLTPEEVVQQVQLARALGADGFVLFSYNAEHIDEQLSLLRQRACSTPTMPGLGGPPLTFEPRSDVFKNRFTHTLCPKGQPLRLVVRTDATPDAVIEGKLRVRTLDGRALLEAPVRLDAATEARVTIPALNEPAQIEVRGIARRSQERIPYLRHSGWFVPVRSAEFRHWLSTQVPPPAGPHLAGVYAYGEQARELYALLRNMRPSHAVAVYQLGTEFLNRLDLLLLSPLTDLYEVNGRMVDGIRDWVRAGGTIVLVGNAVGRHWYPVLFPEVGRGLKVVKKERLNWPPGRVLSHDCQGHVTIELGDQGHAVIRSGQDVLVGQGRLGQGHVWLIGLTTEDLLSNESLAMELLTEAVRTAR